MTAEESKKEPISDFPLADIMPTDGITEDTRRGGEDTIPADIRSAPTSRTSPSLERLSEEAFEQLKIDPIIVGKREGYQLIYKISRDSSRTELFYAQGLDSKRKFVVKRFSGSYPEKFEREKTIQGILRSRGGHKNILLADEFFDEQGITVTPYVRGRDVDKMQKSSNAMLTPQQAKGIVLGLCDALQYLHECNVVHRDVKPRNIVLYIADPALKEITPEKLESSLEITPKLFDYDVGWHETIAHLDEPGAVVGTPHYMAPEVIAGVKGDPRIDIYAAGITLYKLLTKNFPFNGNDNYQIMEAHIVDPVPDVTQFNPTVSEDVQSVLEKALAKDPERRYQTVEELKREYLEAVR